MDGQQGGDPAQLAAALVDLVSLDEPPLRFAAGADAVELFESKAQTLLDQANAHRGLSSSLAHDDARRLPGHRSWVDRTSTRAPRTHRVRLFRRVTAPDNGRMRWDQRGSG
jgi:hypothetical protein